MRNSVVLTFFVIIFSDNELIGRYLTKTFVKCNQYFEKIAIFAEIT